MFLPDVGSRRPEEDGRKKGVGTIGRRSRVKGEGYCPDDNSWLGKDEIEKGNMEGDLW